MLRSAGSPLRNHARFFIITDCPVLGQLADLAKDAGEDAPGLLAVLAKVTDPRQRRGIRYRLVVILGLAVCAVLAGARSFTAIAEWAADTDEETLARLGVTGGGGAVGIDVPADPAAAGRRRFR